MHEDDLEFVKPSRKRTRKPSATLKAVSDPLFKLQVVNNRKKRKPRFKDDYIDMVDMVGDDD